MARVRRPYWGRRAIAEIPLFPGYLFLRGEDEQRFTTRSTDRVLKIVSVADQELLHGELLNLDRAYLSGEPLDLYPRIRVGRRCRVVRGTMQGVEGIVVRRRDVCRVYLTVSLLGQSAELEIDPSLLDVIE